MKTLSFVFLFFLSILSVGVYAQTSHKDALRQTAGSAPLFLDVHHLEPGKVTYEDVAKAHARDLAVQGKYGVDFLKFWVDENKGLVYCLASAADTGLISKAHAEAHGLLPSAIHRVTGGKEASLNGQMDLFLDIHELGKGKVSAADVAAAHQKDLAVQKKYGVNFINYWVDEEEGVVVCLSEAKDSASIIRTHQEAHGLIPVTVEKVKQGE